MEEENNKNKNPKPQILRGPDLLKILPPQTRVFDNISSCSSQSSELSAPFSDVVYSVEEESKRKSKELFGKNLYTAFSFSPEFVTAIEDVKKEMILENPDYLKTDSLVSENLEDIKSGKSYKPPELEKLKEIKFLQFPNIDYEVVVKEEKEAEDKKKEKDAKEKKKKTAKICIDDDDKTAFDTMSGYWRLLSVFDDFKISPPWFDAYGEGKRHWLQTDPIPTDVLEQSRNKCEKWLHKYFDK